MKIPKPKKGFRLGSESELYRDVIKPMAERTGTKLVRIENSLSSDRGTPDCWACNRKGHSYWIELKSAKGKLSDDQCEFFDGLYNINSLGYIISGGHSDEGVWQLAVSKYGVSEVNLLRRYIVHDIINNNVFNYL